MVVGVSSGVEQTKSISLGEIRSTHQKERQKSDLQLIDEDFYDRVGEYIDELYEERASRANQVTDPFDDDKIAQLTDEIETIESTVENLHQRRVGKMLKKAGFVAAGMNENPKGLTKQERELFSDIVSLLEDSQEDIIETANLNHDGDVGL